MVYYFSVSYINTQSFLISTVWPIVVTHVNKVALRRDRLVLGWVTVHGYSLGISPVT